jgi:hypothetical protein
MLTKAGETNPDQFADKNAELVYASCKGGDEPATWAVRRKMRREKELKVAVQTGTKTGINKWLGRRVTFISIFPYKESILWIRTTDLSSRCWHLAVGSDHNLEARKQM